MRNYRYICLILLAGLALTGCGPQKPQTPETYAVSIWVPSQSKAERDTLIANDDVIDEVNLFWYELQPTGEIRPYAHAEDERTLQQLAKAKLRIVPSIMNGFNRERVADVIHDPEKRSEHVEDIVALVERMDYDGIDIDYEGLFAEDRDAYSAFIEELAPALHANERLLSIAVHPKTAEEGTWGGPLAQDWARIGAVVDEFKIMTYDYHYGGGDPGAISPVPWANEVISYAKSLVPAEKIYLGVHFYGYDWLNQSGTSLTWTGATAIAQVREIEEIKRDASNEAWFTYGLNYSRTVYFADALTVRTKLESVFENHPDIAGIAIWRLGGEDPENWTVIRELLKAAP